MKEWGGERFVGGFEVGDAGFEVSEVVDACLVLLVRWGILWVCGWRVGEYLEDGEFVHLLVHTCGDHCFEHSELFVHFGSSPSFDHAVCRLPGDLFACYAR